MKRFALAVSGVVLAVVAVGCAGSESPTEEISTTTTKPALRATGESSSAGEAGGVAVAMSPQVTPGDQVLVDRVELVDAPGFVAIYVDNGGAPGGLLGASELLDVGTSTGVVVELARPIGEPTQVMAMVHVDDNANGTFDYPDADFPPDSGLGVVAVAAEVVVADG